VPLPFSEVEERWYRVRAWMEAATLGRRLTDPVPPEAQWYADRLAGHVSGGTMSMYSRYVLADPGVGPAGA
jgi:hypothetical protein